MNLFPLSVLEQYQFFGDVNLEKISQLCSKAKDDYSTIVII